MPCKNLGLATKTTVTTESFELGSRHKIRFPFSLFSEILPQSGNWEGTEEFLNRIVQVPRRCLQNPHVTFRCFWSTSRTKMTVVRRFSSSTIRTKCKNWLIYRFRKSRRTCCSWSRWAQTILSFPLSSLSHFPISSPFSNPVLPRKCVSFGPWGHNGPHPLEHKHSFAELRKRAPSRRPHRTSALLQPNLVRSRLGFDGWRVAHRNRQYQYVRRKLKEWDQW